MRLLRAAWPVCSGSCLVLALASACGSTARSHVSGDSSDGGNGRGATPGHPPAAKWPQGAPDLGNLQDGGGESAMSSGGGGAEPPPCAGDLIQAERLPL